MTNDHELICADCGASDAYGVVPNFSSVITLPHLESRVYCERCRGRRGLEFLFDERRWDVIAAAQAQGAA